MGCKYYLDLEGNKIVLDGDEELTRYVRENIEGNENTLKIKHSKVSGTPAQNEILNALESVSGYNEGIENPYKFLERQHLVKGKMQYLVPVFIDENYKQNYIKQNPNLPLNEVEKILKEQEESNDYTKILSIKLGATFRKILNLENKNIFYDNKPIIDDITNIVNDIVKWNTKKESSFIINDEDKDKHILSIYNLLKKEAKSIIDKNGILLVGQSLSVSDNLLNPEVQMNASADILAIGDQGNTTIYDIRVSEEPHNKWDTEKKRHADYLLGIKRQLLSNFIDTSATGLEILNIVIPKNGKIFDLNSISLISGIRRHDYSESFNEELRYEKGNISIILRELLPAVLPKNKRTSTTIVDDTSALLNRIFPKHNFRSRLETNPENVIKNAIKNSREDSKV